MHNHQHKESNRQSPYFTDGNSQAHNFHQSWASQKLGNVGIRGRFSTALKSTRDFILRVKKPPASKGGRVISVAVLTDRPLLIDNRTNKPYVNNLITSSIYTVYNFLPRQLVAQFSKLANV